MKIKVWMILTFFFVAILFPSCGGGDSGSQTTQQEAPKSETIEYMLATLDKGYVSRDDITITRFKSLLQQLDAIYADNKQELADSTVVAQRALKNDYGIKETMLNIMEDLNKVYITKVNPSYALYVTGYVMLRGKGLSRQQAIIGVESFLKSIGRY